MSRTGGQPGSICSICRSQESGRLFERGPSVAFHVSGRCPQRNADAAVKAERCGAWGGGWAMLLQGQGDSVPVTSRDTEHGGLRLDSSDMHASLCLRTRAACNLE